MPDAPDLDELLARLRARVELRREQGLYPPGLEEDLDKHFEHLAGKRPVSTSFLSEELQAVSQKLEHFEFSRARIKMDSSLPGGSTAHRTIGKTVGRQVDGVLQQIQEYSHLVAHATELMSSIAGALSDEYDTYVLQQLDDLQLRVAELHTKMNEVVMRLDDLAPRVPGVFVERWYSADAFTYHFRGDAAAMTENYAGLAELLRGCDPVLDVGFGRGEFLELLRDLGVDAYGIEIDPQLVSDARERGLRAEVGRAVEYLRDLDDDSLGGLVLIQVIEHLSPQHVVDVVRLAADKVRPGGKVLVETVNPTSLFAYAHAFWVDPDHARPVHPDFLRFLFGEAGFAEIEHIDRSPVPEGEALELLPGDDETTKRVNANFERLNALVFGAQDYAIVATR